MALPAEENLEMSNYIDIDVYHKVERTHPYYVEMVDEISQQLTQAVKEKDGASVLELGAGTGLLTLQLSEWHPDVAIDALEYDWKIYNLLRKKVTGKVNCVCGDAVKYFKEGFYDVVVSSFAHDHINYDRRFEFAANIRKNLKRGGRYIMGGEVLPYFSDDDTRIESLYRYHLFIINKALRERNFDVAKLEIEALRSGVFSIGDFKRHEKMFEHEMAADFKLVEKRKLGPVDFGDLGGVFVYVFEAV